MTKSTQFVDANIFLRHLTQDHAVQSPACTALFKHAERNEVSLTTSESVVMKVVQVLSSQDLYNFPRTQIQSVLTALLSLPGMKLQSRAIYIHALALYAQEGIDFPDCLTVAHLDYIQLHELYSYDQDFDRFASVKRLEPDRVLENI